VTSGARHNVKARFANETGLHAVGAWEADEETVMGTHSLLAHFDLDRREEVGVLRKVDDNSAGEFGQITGRGDLALVREAVDIGEMRARHSEMLRRLIHAGDERVLAAGDRLCDHDGDVVGGLHNELIHQAKPFTMSIRDHRS